MKQPESKTFFRRTVLNKNAEPRGKFRVVLRKVSRSSATIPLIIIIGIALAFLSFDGRFLAKQNPPEISNFSVLPEKVVSGNLVTIEVEVKDEKGIKKVTAEIFNEIGSDKVEMSLISGDIYNGKWQGKWSAHDIKVKEYDLIVTAYSKSGLKATKTIKYLDPAWFGDFIGGPTGFNYRKQITIAGSTTGAQTNYQMKLTVNKGTGTDSPSGKFEYYNTNDDVYEWIYGALWSAQTFTPSTAHKVTSVKLKISRLVSPGTITVSIKATDVNGKPTGDDLCSGTINGNTLTEDTAGAWYEITLGAGYNLSASTKYAIVVRATSGDTSNRVRWNEDATSPVYAGGSYIYSNDSGSSWTAYTTVDFMFEEWGSGTVYLNNHVQDDFDDIRFTKSDGTTPLDYWTETYTSGTSATVWIEFDSIPISPSTANFYIYYDNASASSASNGDNTFLLYDHFPGTSLDTTNKWTIDSGTITVENSLAKLDPAEYFHSQTTFPVNRALRTRFDMITGTGNHDQSLGFLPNSFGNRTYFAYSVVSVHGVHYNEKDGVGSAVYHDFTKDAWHIADYMRNSNTDTRFSVDGDAATVNSTNAPIVNLAAQFYGGDPSYTQQLQLDWVLIRNYVSPEPTWGTWGSEQNAGGFNYRKRITITGSTATTSLNLQVGASTDDVHRQLTPDGFQLTSSSLWIGYYTSTDKEYIEGFRFTNVTIPQGATITTAYITATADADRSSTVINSRLRGEAADNATTFSTAADYDDRAKASASVYWDNIGAWTLDTEYNSPDIKTIIQEIVNRAGWVSGNALVIFWDDLELRSTINAAPRRLYAYDTNSSKALKLHIEYTSQTNYQMKLAVNKGTGTDSPGGKFEYYNTGDDGYSALGVNQWLGQTFTPTTSHKITSIKLLLSRTTELPNTITFSIRATDVDGKPTGADLCSGTTNGNTLPLYPTTEWREITLGAGCDLAANTKYAIVGRNLTPDTNAYGIWMWDGSSPTYAGGSFALSSDAGVTWTCYTAYDFMFEDWGSGTIYLNNHVQDDFDDIRFTKSDGTTPLDYWTETYTSGTSATVWIEFDSIPASPSTANFYIYYGNASASSASNLANTFAGSDDFEDGSASDWSDTTKWNIKTDIVKRGSYSLGNVAAGSSNKTFSYPSKWVLYIDSYAASQSSNSFQVWANTGLEFGFDVDYPTLGKVGYQIKDVGWYASSVDVVYGAWALFEMVYDGTDSDLYYNGSTVCTSASIHSISNVFLYNSNAVNVRVDDIRIRKYVSPEPTWGTWGNEESSWIPRPPAINPSGGSFLIF